MKLFKEIFFRIFAVALFFSSAALGIIVAQTPQGIPTDADPIDLKDSSDVWMYIIIPVILILFIIGYNRFRKNKNQA